MKVCNQLIFNVTFDSSLESICGERIGFTIDGDHVNRTRHILHQRLDTISCKLRCHSRAVHNYHPDLGLFKECNQPCYSCETCPIPKVAAKCLGNPCSDRTDYTNLELSTNYWRHFWAFLMLVTIVAYYCIFGLFTMKSIHNHIVMLSMVLILVMDLFRDILFVNYISQALFAADLCCYLICLGYLMDLAYRWCPELGGDWSSRDNTDDATTSPHWLMPTWLMLTFCYAPTIAIGFIIYSTSTHWMNQSKKDALEGPIKLYNPYVTFFATVAYGEIWLVSVLSNVVTWPKQAGFRLEALIVVLEIVLTHYSLSPQPSFRNVIAVIPIIILICKNRLLKNRI